MKIQHYTARSLIPGYKIGKEFQGMTLITIPAWRVRKGVVEVQYGERVMVVEPSTKILYDAVFENKFEGGGTYMLYYYEWKPEVQEDMFDQL